MVGFQVKIISADKVLKQFLDTVPIIKIMFWYVWSNAAIQWKLNNASQFYVKVKKKNYMQQN